jgi:hypothetical protein
MASFVNEVMLGEERLIACRAGDPVVYLRRGPRDAEKYVIYKIKVLLDEGASPADFFVLAGSVKGSNSLIRCMENALVQNGIPCYVPSFEDDKMDERVIEKKIVFSTFHSVKGRQRKYVFVMGFDHSYFGFYGRNLCPTECPNTLYVGCTRATHGLFLLERDQMTDDRPLKFLKMTHYEIAKQPYMIFNGMPQIRFHEAIQTEQQANKATNIHNVTPTDLIKFIPEHMIDKIIPLIESMFILLDNKLVPEGEDEEDPVISIPSIIETNSGTFEDVSELNGIAIPAIYFDHLF